MRELIDRKSLIEALRKDIQEYKDTDGQSIPFKTGMIYRQIEAIKIIEEQPTIKLSIKNIVERLEEIKNIFEEDRYVEEYCKEKRETCRSTNCFACILNQAIEIVKEEGGIDDNS